MLYYHGNGGPKDYQKAFEWIELSAKDDNGEAQERLAEMYEKGQGVVQNKADAEKWRKKAAENNIYIS